MRNCKDILKEILESIEGGGRVVTFMDGDIDEIKAALCKSAEPAGAQDEREAYSKWCISMEPYGFNGVDAFSAGATWQRTRPAQTEQQDKKTA